MGRSTSLQGNTATAINRKIGSRYDKVIIVADNITKVTAVSDIAGDVTTVSGMAPAIASIVADKATLDSLYADKATLDSLFTDKAKLDSLFTDKLTLDSLYADKAALDSIFADKATLDGLFSDKATLDRVFTSIANIDRIFSSIDNIDVVFASIGNVDVVAGNIASVNTVATNIASVTTVATDMAKVNNYSDTYQGSGATDPIVRNDGSPLQAGDLFFNTTLNEMRNYTGSVWKSAGSTINGTSQRQSFTATAGQTVFTITGGYDAGFADVYLKGTKLQNGVEVDVSSGTDVVLALGATAGDIVDVVAYGSFIVANTYTKAEVDVSEALKADTAYVDSQDTNLQNQITNIPTAISKVASSVLLNTNSLAISNTAVTKNFADVTYTGNGTTQSIVTGINSVDFTVANNGSGYWLDRTVNQVKDDVGTVVASGTCDWGTNKGVSKVHIKSRSNATGNAINDGLRGVDSYIQTDAYLAEYVISGAVTAFTNNGITLGTHTSWNSNGGTYILYQTLYTHIKWGTTSQGKFYVEAFNPVTKEGMIYYIGSGVAGHQIPHSQGVTLDNIEVKALTGAISDWYINSSSLAQGEYLKVNTTVAKAVGAYFNSTRPTQTVFSVGSNTQINGINREFISYYKCKSETWTIGTYAGTGVAGNKIVTKDVYGNIMKPARVISKRIDAVGNWVCSDNKRNSSAIYLNLTNAEDVNGLIINSDGFTNSSIDNVLGGQYLYIVEFDTNAVSGTPDGSYYNYPTATSNINITSGIFNYTDGKDINGYKLLIESVTGSIDFTGVADGLQWVARDKVTGTYTTRTTKPTFDTATGKWSSETNTLSFLKSPIMVTSETPQYIDYNQELIENVMDSLEVNGNIKATNIYANNLLAGDGYAWVDETANRAFGVTYTNTYGKPIALLLFTRAYNGAQVHIILNGTESVLHAEDDSNSSSQATTFIVPTGNTYSLTQNVNSDSSINSWLELK